jgi:hypothetical protein
MLLVVGVDRFMPPFFFSWLIREGRSELKFICREGGLE